MEENVLSITYEQIGANYSIIFTLQNVDGFYGRLNEIHRLRKGGEFAKLNSEERGKINLELGELEKKAEFYSDFCRAAANAFSDIMWKSGEIEEGKGKKFYVWGRIPASYGCNYTTDTPPVKPPYQQFLVQTEGNKEENLKSTIDGVLAQEKEIYQKTAEKTTEIKS